MKENKNYLNLKKMLKIYTERYIRREELEEKLELSKDQIGRVITLLKKIEVFENYEKGNNRISENLYNKSIFDSTEFNIVLLASLAYLEETKSKEIIKYFFKDTMKNLTFAISNRYSRNFQENIIKLLDVDKYKNFASIIKENSSASKIVCNILIIETNKIEEIIPLEFFIFNNSWFICAYFVRNKKMEIIDSRNIEYLKLLKSDYKNYINLNDIDKCIKDYIIKENKKIEELVVLRLNPETLSLLIEFNLVSEYELFEDNKKKDNKLFLLNKNNLDERLIKINFANLALNPNIKEEIIKNQKINFYEDDTKSYIIKVKLTKSMLNFILNFFDSVEQLK